VCGIVGVIDPAIIDKDKAALLDVLESVIISRGPDSSGRYIEGAVAMGMRRLSVIDPVHGDQPFFSPGDQAVVFQNGEIYNHAILRSELAKAGYLFRTASDTEVLAQGYAAWGLNGLLARIDGMYAIAILDRRSGELHLARDRFGEKPLYYAFVPGRFAYGSDLRVLAAIPWVDETLDGVSLQRYLALHYVPGDRTILKAVRRLLPGETLSFNIGTATLCRRIYYRPPLGKQPRTSDDELAQRLEHAVTSRLVSDKPVGVFLSGGLDSSIIATLAARQMPAIDTFSMGFEYASHDESEYAALLARHIGSRHHHFRFDADAFASLLPRVAAALDEPLGDQAMLPLYWLCHEARKHVTVVLSGEGADEIFGGYGYYAPYAPSALLRDRLKGWLRGRSRGELPRRLLDNPSPVTPSGFPLLTDQGDRFRLLGTPEATDAWEHAFVAWLDLAGTPLQRSMAADLGTWLPDDLLVKFDRMAMAHSLEGRAPYLQPELVELGMARLPDRQHMSGRLSKVALRRVAARWLPPEIGARRKQGFVLPAARWVEQWIVAQGGVAAYLEHMTIAELDRDALAALINSDLAQGVKRERLLFALIMLIEWHRHFRDRVADLRRRIHPLVA